MILPCYTILSQFGMQCSLIFWAVIVANDQLVTEKRFMSYATLVRSGLGLMRSSCQDTIWSPRSCSPWSQYCARSKINTLLHSKINVAANSKPWKPAQRHHWGPHLTNKQPGLICNRLTWSHDLDDPSNLFMISQTGLCYSKFCKGEIWSAWIEVKYSNRSRTTFHCARTQDHIHCEGDMETVRQEDTRTPHQRCELHCL